MKTVPLFEALRLTQNTEHGAAIADDLIVGQVAKGLEALERALLDDFARARGYFSAEERATWRNGPDSDGIRERIRCHIRDLGGY